MSLFVLPPELRHLILSYAGIYVPPNLEVAQFAYIPDTPCPHLSFVAKYDDLPLLLIFEQVYPCIEEQIFVECCRYNSIQCMEYLCTQKRRLSYPIVEDMVKACFDHNHQEVFLLFNSPQSKLTEGYNRLVHCTKMCIDHDNVVFLQLLYEYVDYKTYIAVYCGSNIATNCTIFPFMWSIWNKDSQSAFFARCVIRGTETDINTVLDLGHIPAPRDLLYAVKCSSRDIVQRIYQYHDNSYWCNTDYISYALMGSKAIEEKYPGTNHVQFLLDNGFEPKFFKYQFHKDFNLRNCSIDAILSLVNVGLPKVSSLYYSCNETEFKILVSNEFPFPPDIDVYYIKQRHVDLLELCYQHGHLPSAECYRTIIASHNLIDVKTSMFEICLNYGYIISDTDRKHLRQLNAKYSPMKRLIR